MSVATKMFGDGTRGIPYPASRQFPDPTGSSQGSQHAGHVHVKGYREGSADKVVENKMWVYPTSHTVPLNQTKTLIET